MLRSFFAITAAILLAGCQTYDFEPVQPLAIGQTTQSKKVVAHQLKPNLMLLLDKSGSMLTNTSTQAPCPGTIGGCGPGSPCPAGCSTRISDLKSAMNAFLTGAQSGIIARTGIAFFPKDTVCAPTSQSEVLVPLLGPALSDDDNQLAMQSNAVNTAIGTLNPGGGTPTADSLTFMGGLQELSDPDRQNFVLLLTDGVPNCNANNMNTCTGTTCNCTTSQCTTTNGLCTLGCLDATGAVGAINGLRSKNIKTIVVGFGSCAVGSMAADCANAVQTLNAMAIAGGFARACPNKTDAECSMNGVTDTCDVTTQNCNQAFYAAANANDLAAALAAISAVISTTDICTYQLDTRPSDPRFLSVSVDGQVLQRCADPMGCNTWTYDGSGNIAKVVFAGTTCDKVKAATAQNPVNVQFRIVSSL